MSKNSCNAAEKPCKGHFANGAGELYRKILYTKHKFLFCLDLMLILFPLLYRSHPGSDVSHRPAYKQ